MVMGLDGKGWGVCSEVSMLGVTAVLLYRGGLVEAQGHGRGTSVH